MKIAIWYLLINNAHGLVVIPQASREQCLSNAQWVNDSSYQAVRNTYAACLPGVGQIPEH